MEYEVEVIETLKRQKVIEADSLNQALEKLQEEYKNCNIILNENDFVGVEFRESTDEMIKENFNTQNLLQDLQRQWLCLEMLPIYLRKRQQHQWQGLLMLQE